MYQPKTGMPCGCKRGLQRDNCPQCEGTGQRIDFAAVRARGSAPRPPLPVKEPAESLRGQAADALAMLEGNHPAGILANPSAYVVHILREALISYEAAVSAPRPPQPVERGAASIIISLRDGNISVTHGTDGVLLAECKQAPDGAWRAIWDTLAALGFHGIGAE